MVLDETYISYSDLVTLDTIEQQQVDLVDEQGNYLSEEQLGKLIFKYWGVCF